MNSFVNSLEGLGPNYWFEGTPQQPGNGPTEDLFRIFAPTIPLSARQVTFLQARRLRKLQDEAMLRYFPETDDGSDMLTANGVDITRSSIDHLTSGEIGAMSKSSEEYQEGQLTRSLVMLRSAPLTLVRFVPFESESEITGHRIATDTEAQRAIELLQRVVSLQGDFSGQTENGTMPPPTGGAQVIQFPTNEEI